MRHDSGWRLQGLHVSLGYSHGFPDRCQTCYGRAKASFVYRAHCKFNHGLSPMLLTLPVIAFLSIFLALRKKGLDWRRSALAAAVLWGTGIALSTEALSVPRLVSPGPMAIFWLVVCVAAALYWRSQRSSINLADIKTNTPPGETLSSAWRMLLAAAAVIVSLVGITALVASPST